VLLFGNICYTNHWQLALKGGVVVLEYLFTLFVAPLVVGLAIELFSRWLDGKDDK